MLELPSSQRTDCPLQHVVIIHHPMLATVSMTPCNQIGHQRDEIPGLYGLATLRNTVLKLRRTPPVQPRQANALLQPGSRTLIDMAAHLRSENVEQAARRQARLPWPQQRTQSLKQLPTAQIRQGHNQHMMIKI